jgi:hypothetical protein
MRLQQGSTVRVLASSLAIASCVLGTMSWRAWGQSNPGLTIFSGVERQSELNYYLDFGGNRNGVDRYRLRIPANKMETAVQKFAVSYPDYFDKTNGQFDVDKMEVRSQGESLSIQEVVWNKDDNVVLITMQEPVPSGEGVELVFSNVKNPRWGGTFYFNCLVAPPGEAPQPRALGTWIISIN